jgi:dimethylhistidine N-methyltransferase
MHAMPATNPTPSNDSFARDVKEGLSSKPKYLHAKYFYDKTGSMLFEEITKQPEYYPTRTEASILRNNAPEIRDAFEEDISVVELGSGSANKTTILLESILKEQDRLHYLPIDISPKMLSLTSERLEARFESISAIPIASEYGSGLHQANRIISEHDHLPDRKLVLFLGSSIGNLEPKDTLGFLQMVRNRLQDGDGLLVGFDLQKERDFLHAAYNDRAGVTARFNRNLLVRINRELGGDFELEQFSHHAFYNDSEDRIEMHLLSEKEQEVLINKLDQTYPFGKDETIHTENSYKYTLGLIDERARASGFETEEVFTDDRKWFALALLTPA